MRRYFAFFIITAYLTLSLFMMTHQQHTTITTECADVKMSFPSINRYVQKGDYTILMVEDLSQISTQCSIVTSFSVSMLYAVKYALRMLKRQFNINIGAQIHDTCGNLQKTIESGFEAISYHRPNSTCRKEFIDCKDHISNSKRKDKIFGVVGTDKSFSTMPLASLLSLHKIPLVSHLATTEKLSNRQEYTSFFRTIPSDRLLIDVIVALFKRFRWTYVIGIGSEDDYGRDALKELHKLLKKNSMCLAMKKYIDDTHEIPLDERFAVILNEIKEEKKATVVVLFIHHSKTVVKMIELAKRLDVKKVWLSGGWYPDFISQFNDEKSVDLKKHAHGLMAFSHKKFNMTPINDFTKKQIRCELKSNYWFQEYVFVRHGCIIVDFQNDTFICREKNHRVSLQAIMEDIKRAGDYRAGLIDAFLALGQAIAKSYQNSANKECKITDVLENLNAIPFKSTQGIDFAFDRNGNPKAAIFDIQILKFDENSKNLSFSKVGSCSRERGCALEKTVKISWPYWFKETKAAAAVPKSNCSDACNKGFYMKKTKSSDCCWVCKRCSMNQLTNDGCSDILENWAKLSSPYGKMISVFSGFSFVVTIVLLILFIRYKKSATRFDRSPSLFVFIIVVVFVTFAYGFLMIIKPDNMLCHLRNSCFFLLLVIYCVLALVMTEAVEANIQEYADTLFDGRIVTAQAIFIVFFIILQVGFLVGIFTREKGTGQLDHHYHIEEIYLFCRFNINEIRLTSAFLPFLIWLVAAFFSVRERNNHHSFHKPKFVMFTNMVMGLVAVSCIATWTSLQKTNKALAEIIRCFSLEIFAWTFLMCFIVPRIYIGMVTPSQSESLVDKRKHSTTKVIDNRNTSKYVMENVEMHKFTTATKENPTQRGKKEFVNDQISIDSELTTYSDSEYEWLPAWERKTIYDGTPPMIRKHR